MNREAIIANGGKMIDREKVEKILQVMESIEVMDIRSEIEIKTQLYLWRLWVWCPPGMEEEKRRKLIAVLTPLVGKMELKGEHWKGLNDYLEITAYQAQACKILGYKKVTKTVKKEIKRDPEYEEVEEEVSVPISDCDLKNGRYSQEDIEVPA